MRIVNTETPTFAGDAGADKAPGVSERLAVVDRDGVEVAAFNKDVNGNITFTAGSIIMPAVKPELPAEAELEDVITALIQLGLVTQAEPEE